MNLSIRYLAPRRAIRSITRLFATTGPFPSEPKYSEKYGWQIAISPLKMISVRKWQDQVLVDLRTYWDPNNDGNLVPTKRGIALTEQQWDSLLSHKLDIEKLMDLIRSDKDKLTSSATEEGDLFLVVYINK